GKRFNGMTNMQQIAKTPLQHYCGHHNVNGI
ncbi:hypothetical protein CEXT_534971, partial [Caerostris extrusa]